MDALWRTLVLIACGISVVFAVSGKGYFCRDPDTGFLHTANSTWQATTFCGNYSCRLRRRNPAEARTLLRAINVTFTPEAKARNISEDKPKNNATNNSQENKTTDHILILDKPELALIQSLLPSGRVGTTQPNSHENLKHRALENENDSSDRFLTETEIKTISELLHNVKKSDLEAIVDIYNLAQDIYKEMDKMTSESIVAETVNSPAVEDKPESHRISYWYDPSYHKAHVKDVDMEFQGSDTVSTTVQPTTKNPSSYFMGPLTKSDFGKLPYYYPMSTFQRKASYVHQTHNPQPTPKPPCSANSNVNVQQNLPPYYLPPPPQLPQAPVVNPYYQPAQLPAVSPRHQSSPSYNYPSPQNYGGVLKKPFTVDTQKSRPNLLPYPFSFVQHNNMSSYPLSSYYDRNPWKRFDVGNHSNHKSLYKALSQNSKNVVSASAENNLSQSSKNVAPTSAENKESKPNTDKKKDETNLLGSLIDKAKLLTKMSPEWQTDPIAADVLEEIRAHFEEKGKLLKPLSLRKKIKLERVGKVVKLDDLHREKRSIIKQEKQEQTGEDDLEVYIEKITCLTDNNPGYFRMGNLTEPYPACCPQRIHDNNR